MQVTDDQAINLDIIVNDASVLDATKRMQKAATQFQGAIEGAFSSAISGGKDFDQILKGLALNISNIALKQAIQPLTQGLSQGLSGTLGNLVGQILPFAQGGVIGSGQVQPFAKGGVLSSPTFFPMSGGMGLAGEAGPEAIIPLARGADGRLGVRNDGNARPVSVQFNISTPDASSFRRSEAQVTALLTRAVGRGRRGL